MNIKRSYKLVSKILSAKLRHNWGGMKSEDLSLIKHLVDALYEDWELSQRAYLDITKGFSESDIAELEKDSDRSESK